MAPVLSEMSLKILPRPVNTDSLSLYIQKLKDKNQTEQQRKQAVAAVSIYYQIKKTDQGKTKILKTKNEDISIKKRY